MKIVLVTDDFFPNFGGIAHTLTNLCKYLKEKGHTLFVFNPYYQNKNIFNVIVQKEYDLKKILSLIRSKIFHHIVFLSLWKLLRSKEIPFFHRLKLILYLLTNLKYSLWVFENIIHIYRYLKDLKFDIIVCANSKWLLQIIFILSKIFKKKTIAMAHGKDFLDLGFLMSKSIYFNYIDKIILSNNLMKRLIQKIHNIDENKLVVINRGIRVPDSEIKMSKMILRKEFKIPLNSFILLSVGRLIFRKRFDLVIKAIRKIKMERPLIEIKYFIIGNGKEILKLKKLVNNLDLNKEVKFLRKCDIQTRNKYYKLSDVFLMPSAKLKNDLEGFGIVFLEANYYEIPVIGTKTGGVIEAIVNDETGFLVEQNDLNELVRKILFLYDNEEVRKEMGIRGHLRVIKDFTWDKIGDDYIKTFKKVFYNFS